MSTTPNYQPFDVMNVPLLDSNLIEASAGTGKTYSIAILVLRLLIEKKLPIQEILMVTFTKAAVAELEERIRLFVRDAYRFSCGQEIKNTSIKELVSAAIEKESLEEIQQLLKSATLNLDETSVMTIHGFCQQTLNEFAFETGQLFSAELVENDGRIREEEVRNFWRTHVTSFQTELLRSLLQLNFSQQELNGILKNHLEGKNYIFYDQNVKYEFGQEKQSEFFKDISLQKELATNSENDFFQIIIQNADSLKSICEKNRYARNSLLPFISDPSLFLEKYNFLVNKNTTYAIDLFPELLEKLSVLNQNKENSQKAVEKCVSYLYSFAIQEIEKNIEKHKITHNLLSFDDMIVNLHKALVERENPRLEEELQKKYKAIFIDEFQDTDKLQFEIFKKAFQDNSLVFYIGDPKQSIYAWRKADIETYFKARAEVKNLYSMNYNYRSIGNLNTALNRFFLPNEDFDTFHFLDNDKEKRIDYHPVSTPDEDSKGVLLLNQTEPVPLVVIKRPNNGEIYADVANRVLDLLTNSNHQIFDKETHSMRRILPSDIGILVRKNKQGIAIKNVLSEKGIPAVTLSDDQILKSEEAIELIYILDSFINTSRSTVNRALLTSIVGKKSKDIQNLDEDVAIQLFKDYYDYWKLKGIYSTLMNFINDFGIQHRLISAYGENGERIVTNLYHLLEIIYKAEHRQNLSPVEVLDWLKINVQKEEGSEEDERELRIENDEDAVKIVSIHRSKGLEYNIVFAPTLDFNYYEFDVLNFRDENGKYITAKRNQIDDETFKMHKMQEEQENRRLIYVALTRAVYLCYVHRANNSHYSKSSLSHFISDENYLDNYYEESGPIEISPDLKYNPSLQLEPNHPILPEIKLQNNNWISMSYTRLAGSNEWKVKESLKEFEDDYDRFIFKELRKGAKTGNFLHFIFENLDFTKNESWKFIIDRAVKRFVPTESEEFQNQILNMVDVVMNSSLQTDSDEFKLSSIPRNKCLHEMEFDYPVSLFSPRVLETLVENGILISNEFYQQIEGLMNGKIDLFFENNNKYYILDWKSNYLGPRISEYSTENIQNAMSENNYHLQYLIYTYAVQKYLGLRLGSDFNYERDFGGVFYLFVRGMRKDQNSGVFFHKPSQSQLNILENIFQSQESLTEF